MQSSNDTVAIIGAGPSGLVAARYLKREGFTPILFEQSDAIGGQWHAAASHSSVWPGMRTNTSRLLTCFSDLSHEARTSIFPSSDDVRAYLHRYADAFDLMPQVRLRTHVDAVSRAPADDGWAVRVSGDDGRAQTEVFDRVIVATGRHRKPRRATMRGLDAFTGSGGVTHTGAYVRADRFRNLRVLVCGGNISALEIASELAVSHAARVVLASRRQRYVVQKLIAGVPADQIVFTRFAAMARTAFPLDQQGQALKDVIVRTCGNPEQFGAPRPAEDIFAAGITLSQQFLPLVAEGRITCRPWPEDVRGQVVRFGDGREEPFDAIVLGTGFDIDLPFLDPEIRRTLDFDGTRIDLHHFTFHPDLPGLAFIGQFELVGPYFPVAELQARWIAYAWSGTVRAPTVETMRAGVEAYRARREAPQLVPMDMAATLFAREAGVEPMLPRWPQLTRALVFGPLAPLTFRLDGPDYLPDAARRFFEEARTNGVMMDATLTSDQRQQLQALAAARSDAQFSEFVRCVTREF